MKRPTVDQLPPPPAASPGNWGVWSEHVMVKFSSGVASDENLDMAMEILDILTDQIEGDDGEVYDEHRPVVMTCWSLETRTKLMQRLGDRGIVIRTTGGDTSSIDAFNEGKHDVAIVSDSMAVGYRLDATFVIVVEVLNIAASKQAVARAADPMLTIFVPDTKRR